MSSKSNIIAMAETWASPDTLCSIPDCNLYVQIVWTNKVEVSSGNLSKVFWNNAIEFTWPNSHDLLHLILTTVETNIFCLSVEYFGSSDYFTINFNAHLPRQYSQLTTYNPTPLKRSYSKADWILFRKLLQEVNWNSIFRKTM